MFDEAQKWLGRLRKSFSVRAEKAYSDRDAAPANSSEEDYAAGEGHAYGIAEDEARKAEKATKPPEGD